MSIPYYESAADGFPYLKSGNGEFVLMFTDDPNRFILVLTDPNPSAMRDRILLVGSRDEIEAFGKGIVFGATNFSKINGDSLIQATKQKKD